MLRHNAEAAQLCRNTDGTTILKGCAVVPSGGVTTSGAVTAINVSHPSGADVWFAGVAQEDIPPGGNGTVNQFPFTNDQVRLAANVGAGDELNVANAAGEFQRAPAASQNVAFVAASAGVAGTSTTWVLPIGTRPL